MARDEFDSAGEFVKMADLLGNLLLFTPTEYVPVSEDKQSGGMMTVNGRKDYVVTDIVVLDAEGGPAEYEDQSILQGALIGKLKRKVDSGRKMLGVLTMGEAKQGQKAPYTLTPPTDAQKQLARDYLAGRVVAAAVAPDEDEDPFAVKS